MNRVLSLLVAFVFLQTQAWALRGGPTYPGQTAGGFIGSYAGVLIPELALGAVADPNRATSIGLFTLAQPDVGPATGSLVTFINGTAFNGTITGIIDPDESSFSGIIDSTSTFNVVQFVPQTTVANGVTTTTFERQEFPVFAQGTAEADIEFDNELAISVTTSGTASTNTPARINGTAILEVFFTIGAGGTPNVTQTNRFEIDGFKQSDTATQTDFTFGAAFQQTGL